MIFLRFLRIPKDSIGFTFVLIKFVELTGSSHLFNLCTQESMQSCTCSCVFGSFNLAPYFCGLFYGIKVAKAVDKKADAKKDKAEPKTKPEHA